MTAEYRGGLWDTLIRLPGLVRAAHRRGVNYTTKLIWLIGHTIERHRSKVLDVLALGQLSFAAQAAALGVLYWYGAQTQADAVVSFEPLGIELRAREDLLVLWAVAGTSAMCFLGSSFLLYLSENAAVGVGEESLARRLSDVVRVARRLPDPRAPAASCLGAQLAISVNNCPPPRDPRSRMTSFKRTQRKYVQKAYRVRNWREYETGLRARGSLTVWLGLTDGKLANWNSPRPTRRKPGRQRKYSNHAIETTVTLGLVFGLASRQTEGFLRSLLTLLNLDNDVPDHSTISRRKARLGKVASYERRTVKPVHLLIDSSGLSVHVGQWRTPPKARDYRKLHLAVDEQTSDVVACELTSKRARDASRVASLVGQIERPIASAKADAAYDTGDV